MSKGKLSIQKWSGWVKRGEYLDEGTIPFRGLKSRDFSSILVCFTTIKKEARRHPCCYGDSSVNRCWVKLSKICFSLND